MFGEKFKPRQKVKIILSGRLGFVKGIWYDDVETLYEVRHSNIQTGEMLSTWFRHDELESAE